MSLFSASKTDASKTDAEKPDLRPRLTLMAVFATTIALGSVAGVLLRIHDVFAPTRESSDSQTLRRNRAITDEVSFWVAQHIDDKVVVKALFDERFRATSPVKVPSGSDSTISTGLRLFAGPGTVWCAEAKNNAGNATELRNLFAQKFGDGAQASNVDFLRSVLAVVCAGVE